MQDLRATAFSVDWDSEADLATCVSQCALKAGSTLADALLLIGESSEDVLERHGASALELLQNLSSGTELSSHFWSANSESL